MSKSRVLFAVALVASSILACSSAPTAPVVRKAPAINQAQHDDVPGDTTCRSGFTNPDGRC